MPCIMCYRAWRHESIALCSCSGRGTFARKRRWREKTRFVKRECFLLSNAFSIGVCFALGRLGSIVITLEELPRDCSNECNGAALEDA